MNKIKLDQLIADRIIEVMNRALKYDSEAITNLVNARVECNKELAEDPTIQCGTYHEGMPYSVGLIGILNGVVGVYESGPRKGWGLVAAMFDSNKKLINFKRTENIEP